MFKARRCNAQSDDPNEWYFVKEVVDECRLKYEQKEFVKNILSSRTIEKHVIHHPYSTSIVCVCVENFFRYWKMAHWCVCLACISLHNGLLASMTFTSYLSWQSGSGLWVLWSLHVWSCGMMKLLRSVTPSLVTHQKHIMCADHATDNTLLMQSAHTV